MKNKKRFLNIFYCLEFPCNDYERIKPYFKAAKRHKVSKLNNLSIFLNNSMLIFKLWFSIDPHKVGHSENTGLKAVERASEVFICPVAVQLEALQIIFLKSKKEIQMVNIFKVSVENVLPTLSSMQNRILISSSKM